jgi:hypothetical protein
MLERMPRFITLVAAGSLLAACDKGPDYVPPPAGEYTVRPAELAAASSTDTVQVARVTQEFIRVIGIRPLLGRLFIAQEFASASTPTAVLSNAVWHRRFGSDPSVIGRQIRVNGETVTVVGVTPENFEFPAGAALWLPRR